MTYSLQSIVILSFLKNCSSAPGVSTFFPLVYRRREKEYVLLGRQPSCRAGISQGGGGPCKWGNLRAVDSDCCGLLVMESLPWNGSAVCDLVFPTPLAAELCVLGH